MLLEKVDLPEGESGDWRVEKFMVDRVDIRGLLHGRHVPKGRYTRLMRGTTVVMSDTPAEMREHYSAFRFARGHCLINGLGLGMLLRNILRKDEVRSVTVIEQSKDVLKLVSPHYQDERVEFVHASAFDYKPPRGKRYEMVWHDIWDSICGDNLPAMHELHRKYGCRADWQGSWARPECEQANRSWEAYRDKIQSRRAARRQVTQ